MPLADDIRYESFLSRWHQLKLLSQKRTYEYIKNLADMHVIKPALILKYRHLGLGTREIVELLDVDASVP
jgi:hypothetical protein